jgi:hypothetical protein
MAGIASQRHLNDATRAPGTTPEEQAAAAAQARSSRMDANKRYLKHALRKYQVCLPASGGAGTTQNYSAGGSLLFDVGSVVGGFLEELVLVFNLTVANAAGSSAVYQLNAGAPLTLFDTIEINYGGTLSRIAPYVLKYLAGLQGFARPAYGGVIGAPAIASLQSSLYSTFPVATGNNTWAGYVHIPLCYLPNRPSGMLPIMGDSTRCQVRVNCASAAFGPDPVLNTESAVSGSGHAVTVTGTIQIIGRYTDGQRTTSIDPLPLDLEGEPSCQYLIDRMLNPLVANTMNRTRIDNKLQHLYVISVVIDGNQSTKFSAETNITGLELDEDSVGTNKLSAFGSTGNNVPYIVFRDEIRNQLGNDVVDEGVVPWIWAPQKWTVDPDNSDGVQVLNMMDGGWTDASLGFQLAAVNGLGTVTPRVLNYLVSLNPAGLVHG